MQLKFFKSIWGMSEGWEERFKKIAEAGYDGVETPLPTIEEESEFRELLEKYNLELIAHVYTGCVDNVKPFSDSVQEHIDSFAEQVERATSFQPVSICAHSAKDSMSYDDQLEFFEQAIKIEKRSRIAVGHETHRGRAMYTPWGTAQLLRDLPDLKIVADFSHWSNVCESMLEDQQENLQLAFRHVIHIHARVGYEQGPQVPDFRAPEYEYTLTIHKQWWDQIVDIHKSKGSEYLTFTPEFGPPGYMHTLPFTNQPVVDLWEICYEMGQRLRQRYADSSPSSSAR